MTNKIIKTINNKSKILEICLDYKELGYRLSYIDYINEYVELYFEKVTSKFEYDNYIQFIDMLQNNL